MPTIASTTTPLPDNAEARQCPALAGHDQLFRKRQGPENTEQTPVYAIGFELYENGISRALSLDYNDFVVTGKLSSLEIRKQALYVSRMASRLRLTLLRPLEREPPDHGIVAEPGANAVDGVLGLGGAAVDEVGGVGSIRGRERADADAEQAEFGAVGFAFQQSRAAAKILPASWVGARTNGRGCGS